MVSVVVPFRSGGKSRLPTDVRDELALSMLGDVLAAAVGFGGLVRLVTDDRAAALMANDLGVEVVADPGGGQGAAVQAALVDLDGVCVVVNSDVPRVHPSDLAALARPAHEGALAIVAAADGTTNALGLPVAGAFAPLYGPGSAARFMAHGAALGLEVCELDLPNLAADVDTEADLAWAGPSK